MPRGIRNQISTPPQPNFIPCLRAECINPATSRGLCKSCHAAAGTLVREGKFSWAHLEKIGAAHPPLKKTNRQSVLTWIQEVEENYKSKSKD